MGEFEGLAVGVLVGDTVGEFEGLPVGDLVGDTVGDFVGFTVGIGLSVGDVVGDIVGDTVGDTVGLAVGDVLGDCTVTSMKSPATIKTRSHSAANGTLPPLHLLFNRWPIVTKHPVSSYNNNNNQNPPNETQAPQPNHQDAVSTFNSYPPLQITTEQAGPLTLRCCSLSLSPPSLPASLSPLSLTRPLAHSRTRSILFLSLSLSLFADIASFARSSRSIIAAPSFLSVLPDLF